MHQHFNKKWTFVNSLDQALEVIDAIGHLQVGLAFDTYQLWQEPRLIERIPEIARLTGVVQLSDSARTPESDRDRLMPGEGIVPLAEIIQAFRVAGFSGYFDVQVWSDRLWQSNYAHAIEQCQATVHSMSIQPTISA
jgi:sugar phosphate isomerase/epimerase